MNSASENALENFFPHSKSTKKLILLSQCLICAEKGHLIFGIFVIFNLNIEITFDTLNGRQPYKAVA